MAKKNIIILAISFIAFTIDRLTKFYFVNYPHKSLVVHEDILLFEIHKNQGVAFGLLLNNWIFYFSISILTIILFYLLADNLKKKNYYLIACLSFIIIGGLSNLLDRFRFGAVIDFINVPFWSIFNLSDCYIIIAIIFWLVYLFKYEKVSKKS